MTILTIGGSDSGGGAGIQADLKTFGALWHHGASAVTCVTAQNTLGVDALESVSPEILEAQLGVVLKDFDVAAAKTGALPDPALVEVAAEYVTSSLVVDPVVAAESGGSLSTDASLRAVVEHLFPVATVVTPNVEEAALLAGMEVETARDAEDAGRALIEMGPEAAVVTGGHLGGNAVDVLVTANGVHRFEGSRTEGRFHGTGCTFSAALATRIGEGESLPEAVAFAKGFTRVAIEGAHEVGAGPRPVNPLAWLRRDTSP